MYHMAPIVTRKVTASTTSLMMVSLVLDFPAYIVSYHRACGQWRRLAVFGLFQCNTEIYGDKLFRKGENSKNRERDNDDAAGGKDRSGDCNVRE